jgi:hypothetical protein
MTLLQKLSLAATLSSATFSVASDIPKTILPDNVIRCEPNAGCVTKTLYGRSYKVINTARFTVMVAISHEGIYTRADVSITNKTDMPLAMSPDDFRVEVLTPKPKVLLYVPPANLVLPPPPLPAAAATPTPAPQPPTQAGSAFVSPSSAPSAVADIAATHPPAASEIDSVNAAAKETASQEAAEKAATEHDLSATSIPPNEATSGRVYFERDKHAHLVNVVLPIAGLVFEFPYAMKK